MVTMTADKHTDSETRALMAISHMCVCVVWCVCVCVGGGVFQVMAFCTLFTTAHGTLPYTHIYGNKRGE